MGMHYQISDFMVMMYSGKIVETGNAEEIFKDPLHPYTKMLISSLPRIGDKLKREGIKGSPPSFYNLPQGCRFHPRCPYAVPICRKEEPPVVNINNRSVSCHIIG
jgi:peptide/nickel transport system ATP-binding protein